MKFCIDIMQLVCIFLNHACMRARFTVDFVLHGEGAIIKINISEGRAWFALEMRISGSDRMNIGKTNVVDASAVHAFVVFYFKEDRSFVYSVHANGIEQKVFDQCLLSSYVGGSRILGVEDPDVAAFSDPVWKMDCDAVVRVGDHDARKNTVSDRTVIDPTDANTVCIACQRAV